MPPPPKSHNPAQRQSLNAVKGIPMSVFNQQLLDVSGKTLTTRDRISTSQGVRNGAGRHSRQAHHRTVSVNVIAGNDGSVSISRAQRARRSVNEHASKRMSTYIRPVGSELVSIKQPSCTGLPPTWTTAHDQFIAYLATHAPLDKNGKVPRKEESRERWKIEDIARLVKERFDDLDPCIKVPMIENRLVLLDQAGDNDHFKMPYGAYKYEEWGRGI